VALSIHLYTPAVRDPLDYDLQPDGTLRALESRAEAVEAL
jgi:hypothetical protein